MVFMIETTAYNNDIHPDLGKLAWNDSEKAQICPAAINRGDYV